MKSYEYYEQKQISILGFGVYYKSRYDDNKIEHIHVDVLSDHVEQDARATIDCFNLLLEQNFMNCITKDITKFRIWCDCGMCFSIF
jgi:hypothetical protein